MPNLSKNDELYATHTLDEKFVETLEADGIILPSIDFWIDKSKKTPDHLTLYVNGGIESRLACKYAAQANKDATARIINDDALSSFFEQQLRLPCLFDWQDCSVPYSGLGPIKFWLRWELSKNFEPPQNNFKNLKHCAYSLEKKIAFFDADSFKFYEIENLPSQIKSQIKTELDLHWYKRWQDVSVYNLSAFTDFLKLKNKDGSIIEQNTRTILFADDVERLKSEKKTVTHAESSHMNVDYTCYFVANAQLFKLTCEDCD